MQPMIDDVGLVETNTEKRIRLSASIKVWLIIAITTISLGFSVGLWAASANRAAANVTALQEIIAKMPPPEKVANKEVVDIQINDIKASLCRIEEGINVLRVDLQKQQELTIKQSMKK